MNSSQSAELTHRLAADWSTATLGDPDRALCRFAAELTRAPDQMTKGHILELKELGFSDSAIHDAAQVVSYFNYINRIADSLNVDLEDDVHAWEQSPQT